MTQCSYTRTWLDQRTQCLHAGETAHHSCTDYKNTVCRKIQRTIDIIIINRQETLENLDTDPSCCLLVPKSRTWKISYLHNSHERHSVGIHKTKFCSALRYHFSPRRSHAVCFCWTGSKIPSILHHLVAKEEVNQTSTFQLKSNRHEFNQAQSSNYAKKPERGCFKNLIHLQRVLCEQFKCRQVFETIPLRVDVLIHEGNYSIKVNKCNVPHLELQCKVCPAAREHTETSCNLMHKSCRFLSWKLASNCTSQLKPLHRPFVRLSVHKTNKQAPVAFIP